MIIDRYKYFLVILAGIGIFFLVYAPHFSYPYPLHVDEWHHITEALKLGSGEYTSGSFGLEIGFHLFLYLLSKFFDLISVYKFLPAIWAVFSSLTLFYVVMKKSRNFWISFFAMIFFASIKSNVNILGLWFFTPLTFSIPFIFLYIHFFSEGLARENKKYILISFGIMFFLIFVHSISVFFSAMFLIFTAFYYRSYIFKEWKFFSLFIFIPVTGALFYKQLFNLNFSELFINIFSALQFKTGWTIFELDNSFFEIYSLIGYFLAFIGFFYLVFSKLKRVSYITYLFWPLMLLLSIFLYRVIDVSYFSPYQRNLYYFALSLPLLSAFGMNLIIEKFASNKYYISNAKFIFNRFLSFLLIVLFLLSSFVSYYELPSGLKIYHLIEDSDLEALDYLSELKHTKVMAPKDVSNALYALTGHEPVGALYFYGNGEAVDLFFSSECDVKEDILEEQEVEYVFSREPIDCGWELVFNNRRYVYKR